MLMTSGMAISHSVTSNMYKAWLIAFIYVWKYFHAKGEREDDNGEKENVWE